LFPGTVKRFLSFSIPGVGERFFEGGRGEIEFSFPVPVRQGKALLFPRVDLDDSKNRSGVFHGAQVLFLHAVDFSGKGDRQAFR
jgi:hypothetical protein